MSGYLQLLRANPGYTLLWLAQVISLLGDWFSTIVLATLVRQYTMGSGMEGLAISGLFLAQMLPPLLFSPLAGVLVDRFDRKLLLVGSNVLRAGVVAGLLLVTTPQALWLIYGLRIVQFSLSAVFEPGQSALIPALVPREALVQANTLVSITWSVMLALGALVGGVVSTLFGAQIAIVIDALTFLIAAGLIVGIQVPALKTSPGAATAPHSSGHGFRAGLRYVGENRSILPVLLVKFGGSLGNVDTLITFYGTQLFVLGTGGELSLGLLYSVFGLGALVGPLLFNRFHDGSVAALRRVITAGFALILVGWLVFGAAGTLVVAGLAMLLRAMGSSINWVYSTTIIQKSVPDHFLGRVFSLDMAGFYFASVLSTIVHGALIDILGHAARSAGSAGLLILAPAYLNALAEDGANAGIRAIVFSTAVVSLLPLALWSTITLRAWRHGTAQPRHAEQQ